MSTSKRIPKSARAEATELAHERVEELIRNLGSRIPPDARQGLRAGLEAIIGELLDQQLARRADANDFMSTADAARLLFVSRPRVVKLVEMGKLKLHHKTGSNRFVSRESVLDYQAEQQAAVRAYRASAGDEE